MAGRQASTEAVFKPCEAVLGQEASWGHRPMLAGAPPHARWGWVNRPTLAGACPHTGWSMAPHWLGHGPTLAGAWPHAGWGHRPTLAGASPHAGWGYRYDNNYYITIYHYILG